jgi:hypothetical protein
MKSIKVRGIKNLNKKLQASIHGGLCEQTAGGTTYRCTTYNVDIHGEGDLEDIEYPDTLTKHVSPE